MTEAAHLFELPAMDTGSPTPTALWGNRKFLLYYAPATAASETVVILEFQHGLAIRWGPPSDESLMWHRLWGKGLAFYSAHLVDDSDWMKELERTEAHHRSSPGWIRAYGHYLFTFHDQTVECIARECNWRLRPGGMAEAILVSAPV